LLARLDSEWGNILLLQLALALAQDLFELAAVRHSWQTSPDIKKWKRTH
jgi:hypothetical protein